MKSLKCSLILILLVGAMAILLTGCFSSRDANLTSSNISSQQSAYEKLEDIPAEFLENPPIPDDVLDLTLPDFLTVEQKLLYLRAYVFFPVFCGDTTNLDLFKTDSTPYGDAEYLEIQDLNYHKARGLYQKWDDFQTAVQSIFTPSYANTLVTGNVEPPIFREVEGTTYYLECASGSRYGYAPDEYPDTYKLKSQSDQELSFYVIGHYYQDNMKRDHVVTEDFLITMELTGDGWRFSEFERALFGKN